jgi:hypothetical protein
MINDKEHISNEAYKALKKDFAKELDQMVDDIVDFVDSKTTNNIQVAIGLGALKYLGDIASKKLAALNITDIKIGTDTVDYDTDDESNNNNSPRMGG